jgi:hypothetical protein
MDSDFMVDLELEGSNKNNYFKLFEFWCVCAWTRSIGGDVWSLYDGRAVWLAR